MLEKHLRSGLTLLELLIVLAILAGLAGLVWPTLRRPLAESELQQTFRLLQDRLGDCRDQAQLSGQLVVARCEAGSSTIRWGDWEGMISDFADLGSKRQLGSQGSLTNEGLKLNEFQLPEAMEVERVFRGSLAELKGLEGVNASEEYSSRAGTAGSPVELTSDRQWPGGDSSRSTSGVSGGTSQTPGTVMPGTVMLPPVMRGEAWYIPFLPDGQTSAMVIVVHDARSGMRGGIEVDMVTGMFRMERLTSSSPTEFAEP